MIGPPNDHVKHSSSTADIAFDMLWKDEAREVEHGQGKFPRCLMA